MAKSLLTKKAILIFCCFCLVANANGQSLNLGVASQLEFADYLLEIKEYDRAILEFWRLKYFFNDLELNRYATTKIAEAYYRKSDLRGGLDYLAQQLALEGLTDQPLIDELRYNQAIFKLELDYRAPFLIRQQHINEALTSLQSIESYRGEPTNFSNILNQWQDRPTENHKSPFLAGVFSALIPGSGSIYSGRTQEGIYSFLLVGMFYLATKNAYESDRTSYNNLYPSLALLTIGFYGGSIYTAVNSSYLHNSNLELQELNQLRDRHDLWLKPYFLK